MGESQRLQFLDVWKTIVFVAVVLLAIPAGVAAIVAALTLGWIGDTSAGLHFLAFAIVVGGGAMACWRCMKRPYVNVLAVNSAAVAIGWIVATLVCAVPIVSVCRTTSNQNETTRALSQPINAWFESTSSLSSSGLTVAAKSSELPQAIQLWRSLNQWVGGVGLAVFALLVLESAELGNSIYAAETRDWRPSETVRATVLRVLAVYVGLTIACGTLFALAGMRQWEVVNHCLIVVSTGGLTVTDDSFASYSIAIQCIAAVFMVLGAISFGTLYLAGSGRWKSFVKRTDARSFAFWTSGLVVVFLIQSFIQAGNDGRDSVFNVISAVSTCGISSGKISDFTITSVWLLIVAMFVGGCGDSTAGGIKLNRVVWMLKCMLLQLKINLSLVDSCKRPTWNGEELERDEADQRTGRTLVMLFVFLLTLAIGFLALRLSYDNDIASDRVLFQATSAIGAVGLSMDLTGPDRPTVAKLVEVALMIAGRLEIMALLLIAPVGFGLVRRQVDEGET